MKKLVRSLVMSLIVAVFLALNGCATPQATYPALSEIAPMQSYPENNTNWNTEAVCLVGETDDASWKWDMPNEAAGSITWVRNNTGATVQDLIRMELQGLGYQVQDFKKGYPTRQKRLGVNKVVLFQKFAINKIIVKEGYCYDMKLIVQVIDNPDHDQFEECQVNGRSFVPNGQTREWKDILRDCIKNMELVPEFRKSLELKPAHATNS